MAASPPRCTARPPSPLYLRPPPHKHDVDPRRAGPRRTTASKPAPNGVPMPTLPMMPRPSGLRTLVERETDVKSMTSVESGAAGSVASASSGSKSHSGESVQRTRGLPINASYGQSQLDEARALLRSKESEVAVLEHDRDSMQRELEDARGEMKTLQEAVEEKREELGLLEELKQAKEAASVQDELVGFLQNRLAEIELGAEAERRAKRISDECTATSEGECSSLKADRARLQTESSKKEKELGKLQSRQTQLLACAQTRARGEEASLHAALERVAALKEERAQSAAQEEAMKVIEEEQQELLARLQTAQNRSAQAVPAPRGQRRSSWASICMGTSFRLSGPPAPLAHGALWAYEASSLDSTCKVRFHGTSLILM
ncbi:hypothetical protein FOMPIDRAFT_1052298 [Fomitopsis schrenkii]|uniref:Uncharacterized protein n=1 Tax=Fomitopsis schrenkii TaxID=2126942 RepID=S8FGJ2_FOMSC|nr:hypothetical protein FOMPIDRAFT_1052298 [Fomitopsis schrenkii]